MKVSQSKASFNQAKPQMKDALNLGFFIREWAKLKDAFSKDVRIDLWSG